MKPPQPGVIAEGAKAGRCVDPMSGRRLPGPVGMPTRPEVKMTKRSAYTSVGFIAWKTSSKSSWAAAVARDVRRIVRGTMILIDGWESRRWFLAQDAVARDLVSTVLSAAQAACRADIEAANDWLESCNLSKTIADQHDQKAVARALSLHRRAAAALARAQTALEQAREANEALRRHRPKEMEIVRLP